MAELCPHWQSLGPGHHTVCEGKEKKGPNARRIFLQLLYNTLLALRTRGLSARQQTNLSLISGNLATSAASYTSERSIVDISSSLSSSSSRRRRPRERIHSTTLCLVPLERIPGAAAAATSVAETRQTHVCCCPQQRNNIVFATTRHSATTTRYTHTRKQARGKRKSIRHHQG